MPEFDFKITAILAGHDAIALKSTIGNRKLAM